MILTAAELALVAALSFVAYRRRRDRFWAVLAVVCLGGVLVVVLAGGDAPSVVGFDDVGLGLLAALVAAEAFGLPLPIARRIGIGLRSRQFEYDRGLSDLLLPFNEQIEREPPGAQPQANAAWLARLDRDGERRLSRLERMKAPDEEWATLTSSYSRIYGALLRLHAGQGAPGEPDDVAELIRGATAERERLRAKYRADAAVLGSGRLARIVRGRQ